jgi:hypothetical protein
MPDRDDQLHVCARLVENRGHVSRYEVTAVLTVTCADLGEAVAAVAGQLGELT